MVTAHFFNFKVNAVIRTLPREPSPTEYPRLQTRWDSAHTVRTVFGVSALVCFVLAGLMR